MKYLSQFLVFDWERFNQGKQYVATGVSEYTDYDTGNHLGTKVDAVIISDKTPYKQKDGSTGNNRFEKICFKCSKDVNVPLDARIDPKGVVATVYGDYRNLLSIKCEDIVILDGSKVKANA